MLFLGRLHPLVRVVPFSPNHHQQQTLASPPPPAPEFDQGSAMPPPAAPLVDDLVEEVLLRFPPDDPAALVRAALVCKHWRRLVSGPGFHRRFREFHRTPPMLGMFCKSDDGQLDRFVPTTAFLPHHADLGDRRVLDARHGRVLFIEVGCSLVVWNPVTDEEWKVPFPPQHRGAFSWAATVLCSAAASAGGCDHLDCHRLPFIVVLVVSVPIGSDAAVTFIYTYSSNAAAWSEPTYSEGLSYFVDFGGVRSALVESTLYFRGMLENTILKYNMQLRQMSWIQSPPSVPRRRLSALTTTEDGGLQLSIEDEDKLYIWSTKDANEVDARWEQNRVIKLNSLLPDDAEFTSLDVVGCTDGLGTIFVSTDNVVYAIDLKTYKVKKVYEGAVNTIIPYMSFYTPELEAACTGEEPSAGGSAHEKV